MIKYKSLPKNVKTALRAKALEILANDAVGACDVELILAEIDISKCEAEVDSHAEAMSRDSTDCADEDAYFEANNKLNEAHYRYGEAEKKFDLAMEAYGIAQSANKAVYNAFVKVASADEQHLYFYIIEDENLLREIAVAQVKKQQQQEAKKASTVIGENKAVKKVEVIEETPTVGLPSKK